MNDVVVDNQKLVSTTRASELSGYSKDYIGQLCREEKLICRRISGHWYVSEDSFRTYREVSATAIDGVVKEGEVGLEERRDSDVVTGTVREDTFDRGGVEYVSTLRGAELTGYAQDYIGQLARSGEITAQKQGRRWFVGRVNLLEHKKHNDNLLASVQAKASGVPEDASTNSESQATMDISGVPVEVGIHTAVSPKDLSFNVRYISETDKELVPKLRSRNHVRESYASGDIYEIPIKQGEDNVEPVEKDPVFVAEQKRPIYSGSRIGVDAHIPVKSEVIFNSTHPQKNHSDISILYAGIIVIISVVIFAMYFFFGFDWVLIYSFGTSELTNFLQGLSDSYGEILPGAEFFYTTK